MSSDEPESHPSTPPSEVEERFPAGVPFPDDESVPARCASCGLHWKVHRDIAGFRFRCRCGEWVAAPARIDSSALRLSGKSPAALAAAPGGETAPDQMEKADPLDRYVGLLPWSYHPPGADLRHAPLTLRTQWTNRTLVELCLLMAAFFVPALIILLTATGRERALAQPIAGVAASIMVLIVGLGARDAMFGGLNWPKIDYWIEAVGAALLSLLAAMGWMAFVRSAIPRFHQSEWIALREYIGLPMAFFVIALVPGIFEELAFRGLLQARLTKLFGLYQGMLITGATFALAHGMTLGFPLHAGIGIYLCSLRRRSGSLLPCMFVHIAYNGVLVIAKIV
jgi:membrane protease YdiL (CAAX protease family)